MRLNITIGRNGAGFRTGGGELRMNDRVKRKALTLLLGLMVASPGTLQAQTNVTAGRQKGNRYLLIVETSGATQRRRDGVVNAAGDLIASGMHGQLRPGDTLGVWTYNETLLAGRFPIEIWLPEEGDALIRRVLKFLQDQKYEKQGRPEAFLPQMTRLIEGSQFITVVLISSGQAELRGTPFDGPINQFYKSWQDQQNKARMPFVTVLQATRGKITQYAVSAAPQPAVFPEYPKELLAPAPQQAADGPAAATAAPKAKPAVGPPLIVSGRKPGPIAAVAPPEAARLPAAGTDTNAPAQPAGLESGPATGLPATMGTQAVALAQRPEAGPEAATQAVQVSAAVASASNAQPAQPVVAVASGPVPARKGVWIAGMILAGVVAGVLVLILRRARGSSRASFITRSLERGDK